MGKAEPGLIGPGDESALSEIVGPENIQTLGPIRRRKKRRPGQLPGPYETMGLAP